MTIKGRILSCAALAIGLSGVGLQAASVAYISDGQGNQPWATGDFYNLLDTKYGAGNYSDNSFSVGTSIYTPATKVIFIEGGAATFDDFNSYFNTPANVTALQNWVAAGGTAFINGGTWGGGPQSVGFGVTLNEFAELSPTGTAAGPNPIFNAASGSSWSGNYFSHDTVTGAGLTTLITTASGNVSLAEESYGLGEVIVGGLTAPQFQNPQPQAFNLWQNILPAAVPEPTTMVAGLGALGLAALAAARSRRPTPR